MYADTAKFAAASLENLIAFICVHLRLDLFFFYSRQFVSIRGCFVCLGFKCVA
jgi:hypothetical protein